VVVERRGPKMRNSRLEADGNLTEDLF